MLINNSVSAFQNLLNLIEEANPGGLVVEENQVSISAPTTLVPDAGVPYNTEVTLQAIALKGFTGQITVRYNRPTLDEVVAAYPGDVAMFPDTDVTQALELIAQKYNFLASEIELLGSFATPLAVDILPKSHAIQRLSDNSLLYTGEQVQITLMWPNVSEQLHAALHTTMAAPGYF